MKYLEKFKTTVDNLKKGDMSGLGYNQASLTDLLNLSILAGEFYCNTSKTADEFEEYCNKWIGEFNNFNNITSSSASVSDFEQTQMQDISNELSKIVPYYKHFFEVIRDNIKEPIFADEIIDYNLIDDLKREKYKPEPQQNEDNLLLINILLAEADLFLQCGDLLEKKLRIIQDYLKGYDLSSRAYTDLVVKILKQKCDFLIEKIVIRPQKTQAKLFGKTAEAKLTKHLNKLLDTQANGSVYYKNWIDKILNHYFNKPSTELNKALEIFESAVIEQSGKKSLSRPKIIINKIPIAQTCHLLIRHYAKNNDIEKLKEIEKLLSDYRADTQITYFDQIAIDSLRNLVQNRLWEYEYYQLAGKDGKYANLIKDIQKEGTISKIETSFKAIDDFQATLSPAIKDYHPYQSLLGFIDDFLDYLRKNTYAILSKDDIKDFDDSKKVDNQVTKFEKLIDEIENLYERTLSRFQDNLKWGSSRKYKPVYLTHNECLETYSIPNKVETVKDDGRTVSTDITTENVDVFLDTTYILPDDYAAIKDRWRGATGRLRSTIRSLKNRVTLEYHTLLFETTYKKEIESREFRAVQVLAIFISISTLILGNIKIFEGRPLIPSLIISVSFTIGLLTFNYFIYWFIRSDKTFNLREGILVCVLIVGAIGVVYFAKLYDKDEKKTYTAIEQKVDTLRVKNDSTAKEVIKIKKILKIP